MRKLTIVVSAIAMLTMGVFYWLKMQHTSATNHQQLSTQSSAPSSILSPHHSRDLARIGEVINQDNVQIKHATKNLIQEEKIVHDRKKSLREKQVLLEQSFSDPGSGIKDIKRLQNDIVEMKTKMNKDLVNTERWDPRFVYYLMIQENYTYEEINQIKSLNESGLSAEEVNSINDLIKDASFLDRINVFKGGSEKMRVVASTKPRAKERDEFIDDEQVGSTLDSKLIEMDYSPQERDEMIHGHNLQ